MSNCRAKVDKVFKGYYALQLMRSGEIRLQHDEKAPLRLDGCWAWCVYPESRFSYGKTGDLVWDHRYVAFSGSMADRWYEESLLSPKPVRIPQNSVMNFCESFDSVLHWFQVPGTLALRRARNLLENLIIDLSFFKNGSPEIIRGRRTLKQYVLQKLQQQDYQLISGVDLSESLGMAESTFRRRFRSESGMPVNQFILETRLNRARHLLIESSLSLQEIADRTGFSDVYYFNRMFMQVFHIRPGQLRKSALLGTPKST